MKRSRPFASPFRTAAVLALCVASFAAPLRADPLAAGFRDPPRGFSQVPLWSWNGTLEPEEIRRQIDLLVEQGVYGAFMHARAGIELGATPYFSDGWWEAVEAAVAHGAEVGFATWIYDEDKWPSGAAGGRTIQANPERNTRKGLRRVEEKVVGPRDVPLRFARAAHVVAGRLDPSGAIDGATLVDVTEHNDPVPACIDPTPTRGIRPAGAGKEPWRCPEGEWLLVVYLPDNNPGTEAMPAVNYMNRETVRDFIEITHEEYARRVGEHFGKTIPGVFFDEIHNSLVEIVWVEGFAERFRELEGYDLVPLLPALSRDIGPLTPKVRCDYHDVYSRIYEDAWFVQIADWCEAHDLMLTGHTVEELGAYTTQGSYFRTMRHLQIPGTDNEDFRYRYPRRIGAWKPKQIASVSRLYDRPMAAVEAMGGAGWQFTLQSARYGFNLLAAYGINFFIPHLFHYAQDRPENVDDWPNSWFFRNPFWKYYKTFADHGSRLSYLLTGGEHVADVAVLFPITSLWAGAGAGSTEGTVEMLVAAQIDCDIIDPDSLVRGKIVRDGLMDVERAGTQIPRGTRLEVGTNRYRVIVLPAVRCIRRDVARKLREFAAAGGTLLVHDRWPVDSMDAGRDDPEIAELERGATALGVMPVRPDETIAKVAAAIERDVIVSGEGPCPLRYHHVRRDGRDIYFLANDSGEAGTWRVSFRSSGRPELWDPEDGSIRPIESAAAAHGRTACDVALDPGQGRFVVIDARRATPSPRPSGDPPRDPSRLPAGDPAIGGQTVAGEGAAGEAVPPPVELDGPWEFLPVGSLLDREWRVDVAEAELELPVMRVCWEHDVNGRFEGWTRADFDDALWRRTKIVDSLHPDAGAHRYRTRWDARAISWYDFSGFRTRTGGPGLRCRKTVEVPAGVERGWLAVLTDGPFRLRAGDRTFEGAGGAKPERFDVSGLSAGTLPIVVETAGARSILVEGRLGAAEGTLLKVATDASWEVGLEGKGWHPAWEYVAPPENPIGEPEFPEERPLPDVVWYRETLPRGTVSVLEPKVEGRCRVWVDGVPQLFMNGEAELEPTGELRVVVLRVRTEEPAERGLLEPVRIRVRAAPQELGSWTREGLDWYSGRAIYSRSFVLEEARVAAGSRMDVDLGGVGYCAEVWVNGKLAGTRIWSPYRLDVTDLVRAGENRIDVVVANLIANRMHWDIFDDVKGEETNRKWHDGNILRDAWCLESGLFGPVRIVPRRAR